MSDELLVDCCKVTKVYRRGAERANVRSALPGAAGRTVSAQAVPALSDATFSLQRGGSLAFIGPNGAGKSTILKLVARVIAPTRGRVTTRGRVASLIELGVGFHPDLTGAQNVRFAAAVLGMSAAETRRRYDEIVAFAGLEDYMTTPVKRYSSGMLARLGFSVASHVEADVLVVDEVMAVGDADFQRRGYERMLALRRSGAAVLFVTHNLWVVSQVCDRAIRLDHGRIVDDGRPDEVADRYLASAYDGTTVAEVGDSKVALRNLDVSPLAIAPGGSLHVEVNMDIRDPVTNPRAFVAVARLDGLVCAGVDVPDVAAQLAIPGMCRVSGRLGALPLLPGTYRVWFSLSEPADVPIMHAQATRDFVVVGDELRSSHYGFIGLDSSWSVARLEREQGRRREPD